MGAVKFNVDFRKFKSDMGRVQGRMDVLSPKAETALAWQIERDTKQYVPASQNMNLTINTRVKDGTVIYPGPYAHFLYVGKLFIDPNTGSSWAPSGATKVITGRDLQYTKSPHPKAQSHWFEASKAQNLPKWKRVAGRLMQSEFGR